jgi:hypothetical protein
VTPTRPVGAQRSDRTTSERRSLAEAKTDRAEQSNEQAVRFPHLECDLLDDFRLKERCLSAHLAGESRSSRGIARDPSIEHRCIERLGENDVSLADSTCTEAVRL